MPGLLSWHAVSVAMARAMGTAVGTIMARVVAADGKPARLIVATRGPCHGNPLLAVAAHRKPHIDAVVTRGLVTAAAMLCH